MVELSSCRLLLCWWPGWSAPLRAAARDAVGLLGLGAASAGCISARASMALATDVLEGRKFKVPLVLLAEEPLDENPSSRKLVEIARGIDGRPASPPCRVQYHEVRFVIRHLL